MLGTSYHIHQSINQMATINDSTSDDEYVNILFEAIRTLESCMNIPSGWGDFFTEESTFRFENEPEQDGEAWETVGPKPVVITRAPKWCRKGNACKLANCMFRHERCQHYDNWVASKGRTHGCRHQHTDVENCKSPENGGCKYDHRDISKLVTYIDKVDVSSEEKLWDNFFQRKLELVGPRQYNTETMENHNVGLLIRSLSSAGVSYEQFPSYVEIIYD